MNCDLPDIQAGFRKSRGTRDQIPNIHWIMEKAREFQKNIYFCYIAYAKAFDCVDYDKLWKILKELGIPDHLICLYAGQEVTELDMEQQTGSKRRLSLGRKVMTNLDSILKSRDITLPTKARLVKAMVFSVVMYGCESWTVKKAEL